MNSIVFTAVARHADERGLQILSMHGADKAAIVLLGDVDAQRFEVLSIHLSVPLLSYTGEIDEPTIMVAREEFTLRYEKAKKIFLDRSRDFAPPTRVVPDTPAEIAA